MENLSWINELRNLALEAETRLAIYDPAKLAELEPDIESALKSLQGRLRQCEVLSWENFERLRGEFVMTFSGHEKPVVAWAKSLGVEFQAKPRETKISKAGRLLALLLPICSDDQIRQQCQQVVSSAPPPKKKTEPVSNEQIRSFLKELAGYERDSVPGAMKNFDEAVVKAAAKLNGITGKATTQANAGKLHDLALRFVRNTQS